MKATLQINGIEIEVEVSEEQIEKLTEKKKSPFERLENGELYHFIKPYGEIGITNDYNELRDNKHYAVANYCTNKDLIQQQAWRKTLNRLLWRWQYENDEPLDWSNELSFKHRISYDCQNEKFTAEGYNNIFKAEGSVYFSTKEKAEQAIEEVVKPFMKEHPDFVW